MPTAKISLTLDEELLTEARAAVGPRGLSAFVNEALGLRLQHIRLAKYLAELDAEFGPVPPEVMEEVRREWPSHETPEPVRRSA